MRNAPPESIDDLRAWVGDLIEMLQERMQGSDTNTWETYWIDGKPRDENFCRNRLIEQLEGGAPASIRFVREMSMPGDARADITVIRGSVGLPVEVKGQWHRELWHAARDQLDAKYARDWHAEGRGVYIVLWFGDVAGKNLPKHPDGRACPKTPGELKKMLIERVPEPRRSRIDVFVIDLTPPVATG